MAIVRSWRPADREGVLALGAARRERERPGAARCPGAARLTDAHLAVLEAAGADAGEDGSLLVAEVGGRVVGFATCFVGEDGQRSDRREVTVHGLVVGETAWRRGIRRRLLAAVRRFAAERGAGRVVLPLPAARPVAMAYRALGLRPVSLVLEVEGDPAGGLP